MAEKISKLAIKVNLGCHCCYKRIKKTLCKLQGRENIRTISYDEKNNTVTISGPFDPQQLSKKLRCKACKVIKDIQIVPDPPKVTPPKEDSKKKKEETTKKEPKPEPCITINDIKITVVDRRKDPKCPDQKAKQPDPKPDPKPDSQPKPIPCQPPVWPVCCRMPHCVGYHGGSRCCSCGMIYGCAADGPPMIYGGTSHGGYRLICDEDPSTSCTIM